MADRSPGGENEAANARFVPPPGYTTIPNVLLDEVMPVASGAEWKVTCAIARQTFGWNRGERLLTNAQLCDLTGLSRQSVTKGLEEGLDRGYLGRRSVGSNKYAYGLRVKKVDSSPDSRGGELPKNSPDSFLETRKRTNRGKKTLRGKEKQQGAAPQGDVKKSDKGGKGKNPGRRFEPDPDQPVDAVIVELFELWVEETDQPPNTTLTNNRASQVRARLREQAEGCDRETALATARSQMLEALTGWFESDWHQQQRAFDWQTLFRSRKKVEMFRGRYHQARASAATKSDYSPYGAQVENA
jgi:phage replication O-like protein O